MMHPIAKNSSIIMGRLTHDPECKHIDGKAPVCSFTLAVPRYSSKNEENTNYIPCVARCAQAEFVSQWFSKDTLAIVSGQPTSRIWKDEQGKNHIAFEILCNEISFGETKRQRIAREKTDETAEATGGLKITATDMTSGEVLSGTAYDLFSPYGDVIKQNIPSSDDSAAHIVNLPAGHYILTVTTAPQGYEPIAHLIVVIIDAGTDVSITLLYKTAARESKKPVDIPQGILPDGLVDDDTDVPF